MQFFVAKWAQLETIMLREMNESQKVRYHVCLDLTCDFCLFVYLFVFDPVIDTVSTHVFGRIELALFFNILFTQYYVN